MIINTENPIIVFSEKGKAFAYTMLFYATMDNYIKEYKGCRLDAMPEDDKTICLTKILNNMEVNNVPVKEFFKDTIEYLKKYSPFERERKLCEIIAKDIFCCFDKNLIDKKGSFAKTNRIYCIITKEGKRDYIYSEDYVKTGLFKKELTPISLYFKDLMEKNNRGELPKSEK